MLASSVIVSVPVNVPVATGVNVTLTLQLLYAGTEVAQPLAENGPVVDTLPMFSATD